MTLDRGENPLVGNCSTPLSSVAGLQSLNALGHKSSIGSGSSAGGGTVNMRGSLNMNASPHNNSTAVPKSHSSTLPTVGNSTVHLPASQSIRNGNSLPNQGPTSTSNQNTSFWLELKGVERWYEGLEHSERLTLISSLYARSSEHQLNQFISVMEKTLNGNNAATGNSNTIGAISGQPSANLSRFGVGPLGQHSSPQNANDSHSAYLYRTPLSSGANQVFGAGTKPHGTIASQLTRQSGPAGSGLNHSGLNTTSSFASSGRAAKGLGGKNLNGSGITGLTSNLNTGLAGIQEPSTAPTNYISPSPFGGSSGSSHTTDMYTQAFLPLPRGYSPWGPEIRRPKSATADSWSDTVVRHSPTLQASGSATGSSSTTGLLSESPKISSLSLDTPPSSFGQQHPPVGSISAPKSHCSTTNTPIGHPLKPWKTFTPGQQGTNSGIGQAPDSEHLSSETSPKPQMSRIIPGNNSAHNSCGSPESSPPANKSVTNKEKLAIPMRNGKLDTVLLSDIGAWLRSMRLHKYTVNLSGMQWRDVVNLSDKDLEDRGVNALGARRKLLKMFEEIKEAQLAE